MSDNNRNNFDIDYYSKNSRNNNRRPNRAKKAAMFSVVIFLLIIALVGFGICWMTYRVTVPAGHLAVVTAKSGREPAPGTILVERGEKGIWKDVLAEGRYFFNPVRYDIRIVKATEIPLGKVGIVTSKVGKDLAPGEIIAPDRESKGVWRDVLGPGVYRLNPEGYTVELTEAINIPAGYVGVVTSQTGKVPQPGKFAEKGEKGVLKDILQPGLYYVNHYAYQVNVIEIGMNQVSMTSNRKGGSVFNSKSRLATNEAMKELESNTLNFQQELRRQNQAPSSIAKSFSQKCAVPEMEARAEVAFAPDMNKSMGAKRKVMAAKKDAKPAPGKPLSAEEQIFGVSQVVEFPSRDGFKVSLEMTVEFELLPECISKIYLLYGDLPQVVDKIILPQVLSVSRLKGSSYGAQDFIMGEGRENFQKDLRVELEKTLAQKNIIVHNAIIRTVEIPQDILQPLRSVSLAKEQDLTNIAMQETAKKLGELNTETELIEQRRCEVTQETEKMVATIGAECKKEVDLIAADARLKVAELDVKRSELVAKTTALRGETEAKVKFLTANEGALGEEMLAKALGGGQMLSWLKAVEALNNKVETRVIYAGPGTMWTDLKSAAVQVQR